MNPPKDVITSLTHDSLFSDWKKQHENTFMTHFFCSLSPDFVPKTTWEIGFYNKDSKKIVVFVELEKGFEIKPEDDVFSKETDTIEELSMDTVKLHFSDAVSLAKKKIPETFPHEQLGDGFVVLQKLEGKDVWNFTFVTKSVKFANIRLDAVSGDLVSSQIVELVQKD
ncbi:PepSY domain-containing protein [Candidatus Woesearchaeota archaeon]|nr:PepSY domain-containing protein [Candidatus Woesearchaeota archaeon]MBT5396928.1 PepSY domain-containing protein [Candidatus Woesearchaeota archaeon]MBT5924100.1 PepSY domain-containing protein [Candidatus Woesearchaeota archaeon]MBT6367121.1 PepSY domain-containing protein [Candidatus Woesearchaeota archaeon]MBT7762305.1 PepSY domain-containing protein [Candidatus Woesearchaeota archaeon]